ncbi:SusC/RagA family TonB-linked outer membrane protein [Chitinophaga lutea]
MQTFAQNIKVQGQVKDASGAGLPGVTVLVKGTKQGAACNESGHFVLNNVPANATLVFSFTGFTTKEEPVNNRSTIDVTLMENISNLEDVVVIGYGTQKKRDVTGAISSITAKAIEEKKPVSIFDAIQGAAPGVRVMSNSGAPGDESDITIRGLSTLSDAGIRPLYIVDGVTMNNINSINPNDIQSIEILKDAASAAIYGSRSANGVIIITTKAGEEGKPQVDFQYFHSWSKLSNRVPQSNRLERQLFERRTALGLDPKTDDSTSFARNADNDYQKIMTQIANRNQYDVGVRGGTKNLNYYAGMQYLDEEGILIGSYNKRFSFRSNIGYRASKKLSMNTRFFAGYQDKNNISEGNVIQQALQRPPGMALFLPSGELIYNNGGRRNPIAEATLRKNISNFYRGTIYQSFDYAIIPDLTLHLDGSADFTLEKKNTFNSKLLDTNAEPMNSGAETHNMPIRTQANAFLSYKKTFNKVHNFNAMVGLNYERNREDEMNISGRGFAVENVQTLNGVTEYSNLYSTGTAYTLFGLYARAGYDYKGKYLFNASVRRDGSSRFGQDQRWGNFPAVSAGWRFSAEPFMERFSHILTDGKLRASWGITGNQAIGDYDAITQFVFGNYRYNGISGVRTNPQLGNRALKWEETVQPDLGLELTFLDGKFSFVADYFEKHTSNLLYEAPLPLEAGFPDRVRINAGSLKNTGIELSLTAYPLRTKDFSWMSSVNWTRIRNKITSLPGGNYADAIWYIGEGLEAGNFYGYQYTGIYEYDQSNAWTPDYKTRLIPEFQKDAQGNVIVGKDMQPILTGYHTPDGAKYTGEIKQMTTNGTVSKGGDIIWRNIPDATGTLDGNIGNEDRTIIGYGQPRWGMGWSNSFTYRNFSLSFNVYGNFGNHIYNEHRRNITALSITNVTPDPLFIYNSWKYPGQITESFRGADRAADNSRRGNSYFIEKGDFIRLQTVNLGYNLDSKLAQRLRIRAARAYVYGNNLLVWTSYTGFDPEVSQRSVLKPGEDPGRYPRRREVGVGLNVSF